MKKLIFVCFSMLLFFSCQEKNKKSDDAKDSSTITQEEAIVTQLAAFYTGSIPCEDCEEIVTLLTLNADEKRSFTLEETYKGKEEKTLESVGTWAVDGDVVTLTTGTSGILKYQVTSDGLVSLGDDGSKRDSEGAKKYLLKKVLGE